MWTAALCLLVAVVTTATSIGWVVGDRQTRRAATEQAVNAALQQAQQALTQRKWSEALSAAKRAEGLLASDPANPELEQRLRQLLIELGMIDRLEEIQLLMEIGLDNQANYFLADPRYAQAFQEYGIDVDQLSATEAAARIRERSIQVELAAALDGWADKRRFTHQQPECSGAGSTLACGGAVGRPGPLAQPVARRAGEQR